MSLFSVKEIESVTERLNEIGSTTGVRFSPRKSLAMTESKKAIRQHIGDLQMGDSLFFMTDGAWSNIQVLEYILEFTGPANVFFTTWSISSEALSRFSAWTESGSIKSLHAILDQGLRNRKPDIYQQAIAVLKKLRIAKCHAKVTVIRNDDWAISVIGSANYTRNPRKEAGVIVCDNEIADGNISWILDVFANDAK